MANVTTPITYDVPSSFTYDNSKIKIQDNVASLAGTGPYDTSNPPISSTSELDMSALSGFTEVSTVTGSDATRYLLTITGVDYYWNGAAWVASNGTYAQSNPAATINTNAAHSSMNTLLSGGAKVFVKAFLHSATGATTPTITSVSVTYTFNAFKPANPPLTTVYLWLTDILDGVIGTSFSAKLSAVNKTAYKYGNFVVMPFNKNVTFDSNGYAAISLMETSSVGMPISFTVTYADLKTTRSIDFNPCTIPNSGAISLTNITQVKGTGALSTITQDQASFLSGVETQENINNNVSSSFPLTGIIIDPTKYIHQTYLYTLRRYDGTNFYRESGLLVCDYNDISHVWTVQAVAFTGPSGPTTGVTWSGQTGGAPTYYGIPQYQSDNMTGGSYKGTIRYQLIAKALPET